MDRNKPSSSLKVVVIMGPTASGKSELAVRLAQDFNGAIISADSRQIYKGLNVATTKISQEDKQNIPHYMLDIVEPNSTFTVADYQKHVYRILNDLRGSGKLPIIVGGTGLYVQSVIEGLDLSIPPDPILREELNNSSLEELVDRLRQLDPNTKVDLKNKVRVVRAIEVLTSGRVVGKVDPNLQVLKLAISVDREEMLDRITKRIQKMDLPALVEETKIYSQQLSLQSKTTIGYDVVQEFIDLKIDQEALIQKLIQLHKKYAKRQMTWLRREQNLTWIRNYAEAKELVESFLAN